MQVDRKEPSAAIRPRGFRASDVWQRALPTGLLGLALVGVPVLVFQPEGLPRMQTLSTELSGVQDENEGLRREIGVLRNEVARLRDDPTSVERIARDQLGLVRKNEVVLQFGTSASSSASTSASADRSGSAR